MPVTVQPFDTVVLLVTFERSRIFVQPEGMPLTLVGQLVDAAVKVPDAATPESQSVVQYDADMLVARQVTLFKLEQFRNINL